MIRLAINFFICLILFLSISLPAQTLIQPKSANIEWNEIGPEGVSILSLVQHPINKDWLYAVVDAHGIYKSIDGGKTWIEKNKGIENLTVLCITFADETGQIIYAGTIKNGIFKSFDAGESWFANIPSSLESSEFKRITNNISKEDATFINYIYKKQTNPNSDFYTVDESLSNTDEQKIGSILTSISEGQSFFMKFVHSITVVKNRIVYAGIGDRGIFTSIDVDGWDKLKRHYRSDMPEVRVIVYHPMNQDKLYIGATSGIFKSSDKGKSWKKTTDLQTNAIVFSEDSRILYAGGEDGLYRSTDDGEHWMEMAFEKPQSLGEIRTLYVNHASLYVGGDGGIYEYSDNKFFNRNGNLNKSGLVIRGIVKINERLFIGTGWGIYAINDGGDIWEKNNDGLPKRGLIIKDIVIDASKRIYIATWGGGVYESDDFSRTWNSDNEGLEIPYINEIKINEERLHVSARRKIYSKDYTTFWQPILNNNSLSNIFNPSSTTKVKSNYVKELRFNQGKAHEFYALLRYYGEWIEEQWINNSAGIKNWKKFQYNQNNYIYKFKYCKAILELPLISIIPHPKKPLLKFVISADPVSRSAGNICISDDEGKNWYQFSDGSLNLPVKEFVIGGDSWNDIYISTYDGIYHRNLLEDDSIWNKIANGPYNMLIIDPLHSERMFAANNKGEFIYSGDYGESWTLNDLGSEINAIALDPNDSNIIYAATERKGLLRANIKDLFPNNYTWILISSIMGILITTTLVLFLKLRKKVDPLEVAKLFFAKAGFEKVEPLPNNLLCLYAREKEIAGIVSNWEEGKSSTYLIDFVKEYTKNSQKKINLYLVYSGQSISTPEIQNLREEIHCEVIPMQAARLEKSLKKQSQNDLIQERRILEEPFLTRIDPYADYNPIHISTMFYGREDLMKRLPLVLSQGQHVGIFGLRKVGKTSLIGQIKQRFITTVVSHLDCQAISPKAEFYFEEILKQIQAELHTHDIKNIPQDIPFSDNEGFRNRVIKLFELWKKSGQQEPFIIILDEIDKFFPDQALRDSETILAEYVLFFGVLRGLAQTSRCLVTLVIAYRPDVNRRNTIPLIRKENPMFNSFQEEYLGFLSSKESNKMIQEIGGWKGIKWENNAVERVFYYCGGHPLVTRYFASQSCDGGKLRHIDLDRVEQTAIEIQNTYHRNNIGNYYKAGILETLQEKEIKLLSLIIQQKENVVLKNQFLGDFKEELANLENFGLVAIKDEQICITAKLFEEWLQEELNNEFI